VIAADRRAAGAAVQGRDAVSESTRDGDGPERPSAPRVRWIVRSCIVDGARGPWTIGGATSWPTYQEAEQAIVDAELDVDDFHILQDKDATR
jgi:hypothetical protein